ncbi:hypothetical protein [Halomonas sp. YLGW01]|uniref:hypothetical protein n=1 Tax=Halomonas sp. YLGW01 TaxID=2773308 RepID=UPI001783F183|nr:hypothetical protein [Halomonas sp. YLGW01]
MKSMLHVLVIPCLLALAGCGGADEVMPVPLPVLAAEPAAYDGKRVATSGVVRSFAPPRHYWIEDQDLHRVEIVPPERVAAHLGREVSVVGRFRFTPDAGRRLEVEALEPLTVDEPVR